jgi:hypothetical protein
MDREQRMIAAHKRGVSDARQGKSEVWPLESDESIAYRAGYRAEKRRMYEADALRRPRR